LQVRLVWSMIKPENMKDWIKKNQQKIALGIGYALVFFLAFGLGKITTSIPDPPEIIIEEPPIISPESQVQGTQVETVKPAETAAEPSSPLAPVDGECPGKIKGNIGSSGNIYHVPGGSFYDRTIAELCFATEADAVAAGFRASSR